jgi:hypothetical protein
VSTTVLTESAPLAEAGSKGIWRSRIIAADVQGSSGYYPAGVLRRDGPTAFSNGTHVYLDHPSSSEEQDRPERSVRDLAGYLIEDAQFEDGPDGPGLFARVQFLPHVKELIKSIAEHVGLSIRAAGEIDETPTGRVVQSIKHGLSVDVVTRAGAGGRLITMTESTKPDSPPAEQGAAGTAPLAEGAAIPSTLGGGSLLSEVASMKETLSDRVEQLSIEVARMGHQLKESQARVTQRENEAKDTAEAVKFLKERQQAADALVADTKQVGQVVGTLMEAKLPLPSLVRLAQAYVPGQDLHAAIQQEKEYLKKVIRESEAGALARSEGSGLGLVESMGGGASDFGGGTDQDFADLENVLGGRF